MDWLPDVYLICALVGGTILVLQTIMMLVGIGGDHDVGHDVGGDAGDLAGHDVGHVGDELSFLKWLSLKTIVSSLTFFGLAGLAAGKAGWSPWMGLGVAIAAGTAAVVALAFLMASLARLQSRGISTSRTPSATPPASTSASPAAAAAPARSPWTSRAGPSRPPPAPTDPRSPPGTRSASSASWPTTRST